MLLGSLVGIKVGMLVGSSVGSAEGSSDGSAEGSSDGTAVGPCASTTIRSLGVLPKQSIRSSRKAFRAGGGTEDRRAEDRIELDRASSSAIVDGMSSSTPSQQQTFSHLLLKIYSLFTRKRKSTIFLRKF
jgi:hypothetical protein